MMRIRALSLSFVLASFSLVCHGVVYNTIDQVPTHKNYDFLILGGGTAGCVIANRLTEDTSFKVLVIEAGPKPEGLNVQVPFFVSRLVNTMFDWNFTTVPQTKLDNRVLAYPRGYALGGTNNMFYTRGSEDDYNRWAAVTEDKGWSFKNLLKFIYKNERLVRPADNHNTSGEFNPRFHSVTGANFVSLPGFMTSINPRVLQTTTDLPAEFHFNLDMNGGKPLGIGWLPHTIGNGQRSSAATSYLGSHFTARKNLDIALNTRVLRLLPTVPGKVPEIRTVQVMSSSNVTKILTAEKEVVLSTGSVGSPVILLHSGIGDPRELENVGIKPLVNLSSVGKNLTDHPSMALTWATTSTDPIDNLSNNATLLASALMQWETNRTGPLTIHNNNHLGFVRLPQNSSIFSQFPDPSSGPNSPHVEMVISAGGGTGPTNHTLTVRVTIVSPASRGSISIKSLDPLETPLIDPGFLTAGFDLLALKEAVTIARKFVAAPAWDGFVLQPIGVFANVTDDVSLKQFILNNTGTVFHPVGTAAMSAPKSDFGVVNPDLRVKGVEGLRIVDASIMPFITCGHTQSPVYTIAERAAQLILDFWSCS